MGQGTHTVDGSVRKFADGKFQGMQIVTDAEEAHRDNMRLLQNFGARLDVDDIDRNDEQLFLKEVNWEAIFGNQAYAKEFFKAAHKMRARCALSALVERPQLLNKKQLISVYALLVSAETSKKLAEGDVEILREQLARALSALWLEGHYQICSLDSMHKKAYAA